MTFQVHADLLCRVDCMKERRIALCALAAGIRSDRQCEVSLDLEAIGGHADVHDISDTSDTIRTQTRYVAGDEPHCTFQVLRQNIRVRLVELPWNNEGMCWMDVVVVDIDQVICGCLWCK